MPPLAPQVARWEEAVKIQRSTRGAICNIGLAEWRLVDTGTARRAPKLLYRRLLWLRLLEATVDHEPRRPLITSSVAEQRPRNEGRGVSDESPAGFISVSVFELLGEQLHHGARGASRHHRGRPQRLGISDRDVRRAFEAQTSFLEAAVDHEPRRPLITDPGISLPSMNTTVA